MEELVFVLPTFIIFFIILFQIFSLFRRGFDFVRKRFNLSIDQAGEETERKISNTEAEYDQDEVKQRIKEAEKESVADSKERILNQNQKNEKEKKDSKYREKKKINKQNPNQKKRNSSSLGKIFEQYNEVEKAVIYNEILSKPKALRKD